ncbi:hypothetical protein AXK11_03360 [Cephaloticoccus primus]|uniref:SH3b domain-containing protein n=1 Tax=Cephaloticoccus primus TaxID=1548207 RepID=A0A139SQM7_9BACT|nr:BatD family protein [Cephaloticoccus primus]KXU36842.1 hypothetical protein AXK11_03360 [Cephaloticoccus primus]
MPSLRIPPAFAALILCFAMASSALAQRVFWSDAGTGDPADIQLVFENCKPEAAPELPALSEASFHYRGQSTQVQVINFSRTSSLVLSYRLQITVPGQVAIPDFDVQTDKGLLSVPPYTTGTVQPGPESDIKARLTPRKTTVWAGEVFPLVYSIDVARRSFSNFGDQIQWEPSPLVAEDWSEPSAIEANRAGEVRLQVAFRTRAYARAPGTLRLSPVRQLVNLNLGTVGFGFFQQPRIEQVSLSTDQPELHIQPLPLPAPARFIGGVGDFELKSTVVPQSASVGEPITWTLELSGTGNWPEISGLPPRSVSSDFQAIQPPAKHSHKDGQLFDGTLTEDVVLIPTRPGTYTLGPYELHTFDVETGSYRAHSIPATTLTVTAATAAGNTVAPSSPAQAAGSSAAALTPPTSGPDSPGPLPALPGSAPPPEGLLQGPIDGSHVVRAPTRSTTALTARALAPFGLLGAAWLALALRRAHRLDPLRPRREARAQLATTLAALRQNPSDAALLIDWQQHAAKAHGLSHALPPAAQLPDSDGWQSLWAEAEQSLYRAQTPLPSDWLARAEAALAVLTIPGTAWARALRKQNLCPWLFSLALALVLAQPLQAQAGKAPPSNPREPTRSENADSSSAARDTAHQAYAGGDFDAAAALWQAAVAAQPRDWAARHNLALALAQQEQWAAAAAQATAAFVQNPREPNVRWNLAGAYSKAGYSPEELRPVLREGPRSQLARLASPGGWECALVVGSSAVALGLLLPLLRGYGLVRLSVKAPALALALCGLLLAATALAGRASYGLAAQPQAALVWRAGQLYSIPTEADTEQQTAPLAAGVIGIAEGHFLGWARLRFANGQSGWVRNSELVPLWETPPQSAESGRDGRGD